jgi:hypothetical protein
MEGDVRRSTQVVVMFGHSHRDLPRMPSLTSTGMQIAPWFESMIDRRGLPVAVNAKR